MNTYVVVLLESIMFRMGYYCSTRFYGELFKILLQLSHIMRKPAFWQCENKSTDQLHGYYAADQPLCYHYIESTIPLLSRSEISSLLSPHVVVQPSLCRTWLETAKTCFLVMQLSDHQICSLSVLLVLFHIYAYMQQK